MAKLLLYLLEVSVVLALLYLLYALVLRKETFFSLNRFFLLGIVVISLLFPLLSFDFNPTKVAVVERPIEEISRFRMSYYEAVASWDFEARNAGNLAEAQISNGSFGKTDWSGKILTGLIFIYAIGIVVCLSGMAWTLTWIGKMIKSNSMLIMDGVKVVKLPEPVAPFSFSRYVFAYEKLVDGPEFSQILEHEKIHIRQRHSADLLFVQLLAAFLWFNPIIWRLIKSLKTTHEYIADNEVLNMGHSLVEYQTMLLSQLISNNSYGLVHNFNLSFIKKRITMMKNKKSGWSGKVKVAMALGITMILSVIIVQCNSNIDEVSAESEPEIPMEVSLPVLPQSGYSFDGDLNNALDLVMINNKLFMNGVEIAVDEIGGVMEKSGLTESRIVVTRIDKGQEMKLVREVMWELRKADCRRLLYKGLTAGGEGVEMPLLLPPHPDHPTIQVADFSELEASGDLTLLKVDLGNGERPALQSQVYDFVKGFIRQGSLDYAISARYDNKDTYNDYLVNLFHIHEGFNKIYQERAHEMFGKDFYDLEKEEYNAVRKGVPRAISIADMDG